MRIQIDRDLPVPLAIQIRGLIEYGVSNGDFRAGSRLPSVRDLAAELGVSPVTVSQAYKILQERGVIDTFPGRGTFVREELSPPALLSGHMQAVELLRHAIGTGLHQGMSRPQLLDEFHQLLGQGHKPAAPVKGVFVGNHLEVTQAYVADLLRHLPPGDRLSATTFDALAGDPGQRLLAEADFIFTLAHRVTDLEGLLPDNFEIATVQFIPSERTRLSLAEIDPLARVVLVSVLHEFLLTLRHGVNRFASHVADIRSVAWGTPGATETVTGADVVVYGTGSEAVLDGLSGRIRSFEYRYVPDPLHTEHTLLPFLDRVRAGKARPEKPAENVQLMEIK